MLLLRNKIPNERFEPFVIFHIGIYRTVQTRAQYLYLSNNCIKAKKYKAYLFLVRV